MTNSFLLPHQRVHGWLRVHSREGMLEVPLIGEPAQDEQLERVASAGGRFVVRRYDAAGAMVAPHGDAWEEAP